MGGGSLCEAGTNTSEVHRVIWVVQMLLSHLTRETETGKNKVVAKTIQPVNHEGRIWTQTMCPYKPAYFLSAELAGLLNTLRRSRPRASCVLEKKEAQTEGPWEAGVERLCHPSRPEEHSGKGS